MAVLTPRRKIALGFTLLAIAIVLAIVLRLQRRPERAPLAAQLTCEQAEPKQRAAEQATEAAFTRALAAKGMKVVALEPRWLGGMMGVEKPEDLDAELGATIGAWQQFTYTLDGHPRQAIADEPYQMTWTERAQAELAQDEHGGIWRVRRAPTTKVLERVKVEACSWGCWGKPPPGTIMPPNHKRDIYLLPANSHYRGTIEIRYEAPTILYEIVDLGCATPA